MAHLPQMYSTTFYFGNILGMVTSRVVLLTFKKERFSTYFFGAIVDQFTNIRTKNQLHRRGASDKDIIKKGASLMMPPIFHGLSEKRITVNEN